MMSAAFTSSQSSTSLNHLKVLLSRNYLSSKNAPHFPFGRHMSSSTSSSTKEEKINIPPPQKIAIVGGGLSGLSTAYHLLHRSNNPNSNHTSTLPSITIFDKALPGEGGASSVAGGLLHPFSPRGKLVHFGKEGLYESNVLLDAAMKYSPDCVLRDKLYRIALTEKNVKDLQQTASLHPEYATWLSSKDIESYCGSGTICHGGVLLTNGCKVIHVPSYLSGLWKACEEVSSSTVRWSIIDICHDESSYDATTFWKHTLKTFDSVVFSAGSGLFHDSILNQDVQKFPIELVRGQSVEMTIDDRMSHESNFTNQAILCGKYIAPLNKGKNQVLIGATHEYKDEPFEKDEVLQDLRSRSFDIAPFVWEKGKVDRITSGYRVQSRRGKYGRIPMIGKVQLDDIHHNAWLITGLSARGLIYHGIYGKVLSEAIVRNDESKIQDFMPDALWWK